MEAGRCLVCWKPAEGGDGGNVKLEEGDPSIKSKPSSVLTRQLNAIFVLRVLLKVPTGSLKNYFNLSSGEHPSHWVHLCGECGELVENARAVYEKLLKVRSQLKGFQREISERVKSSYEAVTISPEEDPLALGEAKGGEEDVKPQGFQEEIGRLVRAFVYSQDYEDVNPFIVGDKRAEEMQQRPPQKRRKIKKVSIIHPPQPSPISGFGDDLPQPDPEPPEQKPKVPVLPRRRRTLRTKYLSTDVPAYLACRSKPDFECRDCGQSFPTIHLRKMHKIEDHGKALFRRPRKTPRVQKSPGWTKPKYPRLKPDYDCRTCGQSFATRWLRMRHKRLVHGIGVDVRVAVRKKDPHSCVFCKLSFESPERLKLHRTEVHPNVTSKKSWDLEYYYSHKQAHQCPHCPYKSGKLHLERHVTRMHGTEAALVCDLCGKGMLWKGELKPHLVKAHNRCLFKDCDYQGEDRRGLWEHQTGTHAKEKDVLKCSKCEKLFYERKNLNKHQEIHEREKAVKEGDTVKTWQCDVCGKNYSTKNSLQSHRGFAHPQNKKKKAAKLP